MSHRHRLLPTPLCPHVPKGQPFAARVGAKAYFHNAKIRIIICPDQSFCCKKTVKMLILQQRDRDTELRDYPTLLFPNVPKRNAKETIRYLPRVLFLDSR